MAKNANFVSHKKSKQIVDGKPKLPLASDLVEGEIAINFGKDVETLSIKNESGDVVTFSSDNYYTEKKLGSGFTGENSGVTVTEAIENSEYWTSGTGESAVVLKNSSGTASGNFSVAEGYQTSATSNYSHAEGNRTIASGSSSHAEGQSTKAIGRLSHAEGYYTTANGTYSHAEGANTTANGNFSHAEGLETTANNKVEHASGQFNISYSASTEFGNSGNTLFSVGNGTEDARHNAFEIRQNGDIYIVNKGGNNVKLQDEIGNIEVDQTIDSGTSASTNAVSTSAVYGFVTSYTPSITVDQVLDDTTSASTNPVSSKAVYDAVTDNELVWTNAFVALSGTVSAHTENTDMHVTAADKTAWNAKLDASAIVNFFDDAKYEDSGSTKVINFYHGNTIKATIDASDFIVDGMVEDVKIENGYLVVDFNTASGKQDISIPLTDIFDPSNYYTTAQTSGATELTTAFNGKTDTATTTALNNVVTAHTADTSVHFTTGAVQTQIDNSISGKVNTSDIVTAITSSNSGSTNPIATKVVAENELVVSTALNDLNQNKADKSTTYTKTEIDDMIGDIETLLAAI